MSDVWPVWALRVMIGNLVGALLSPFGRYVCLGFGAFAINDCDFVSAMSYTDILFPTQPISLSIHLSRGCP